MFGKSMKESQQLPFDELLDKKRNLDLSCCWFHGHQVKVGL